MVTLQETMTTIKQHQLLTDTMLKMAEINEFDAKEKLTPLMLACKVGNLAVVRQLLNHELIDVNVDNEAPNYKTAVMMVVDADNIATEIKNEIILMLVNYAGLGQKSLDCALVYFAGQGLIEAVQKCIEKKANVNANYLRLTALTEAISHHHSEIANYLLAQPNIDINLVNYRNETPLIIAVVENNQLIVNHLLSRPECKLNHISPLYGTALTAAIFLKNNELTKLLISQEKQFNPNHHPGAFNWAVRHENLELVALFIEHGAAVNNLGDEQYNSDDIPNWIWQEVSPHSTPLYPNPSNNIFELPIILAAETGNLDLVQMIGKYADLNKESATGQSILELMNTPWFTIAEPIKDWLLNQSKVTINSVENTHSFFNLPTKTKEEEIKEKIFRFAQQLLAEYPEARDNILQLRPLPPEGSALPN